MVYWMECRPFCFAWSGDEFLLFSVSAIKGTKVCFGDHLPCWWTGGGRAWSRDAESHSAT